MFELWQLRPDDSASEKRRSSLSRAGPEVLLAEASSDVMKRFRDLVQEGKAVAVPSQSLCR